MKCVLPILLAISWIGAFCPSVSHSETPQAAQIKQARDFATAKDWAKVVATLKPLSDSLSSEGLLLLAKGFKHTGDSPSELRVLELCLAKNAKDVQARVALGDAYSRANRSDDAIAAYREARQQNAKFLPAYLGLLNELLKQKDTYEARTLLHDMVKTFGPKPEFNNELCRLYSAESYIDKAIELCQQAIEKDPKTPENFVYLATSLREKLEDDKATKVLSDALKRFPSSEAVLTAAGENQMARKNFVVAYKNFRGAVGINRKSARAVLGYAQAAFELQKNQEALDAFVQACTLNRAYGKEFRTAIVKLRARKDLTWQFKFEEGSARCP